MYNKITGSPIRNAVQPSVILADSCKISPQGGKISMQFT